MKNKKMIFACGAFIAAGCLSLGALTLTSASANATTYEGFKVDGASIRVSDPTGIRFTTSVPETIKEDYTFGTLMIPVAELGGAELTMTTPNVANMVLDENGVWQIKEEGKAWKYTSVLAGVSNGNEILAFPKSQYKSDIAARSYALNADGDVVYYTETTTRSVAYVASTVLAMIENDEVATPDYKTTLTGIVDYVLGGDGFAFASETVEINNKTLDLSALFAESNGNEGMTAIWQVEGDCISLQYNEDGVVTGAVVNGNGTATISATIGSTTKSLSVTVDLAEWYQQALQFNSNDSLAIVENSYVKDGFPAASIITDGDRTVLSGVFTAKTSAGYKGALTIGIGGEYKASEIGSVVITLRVPELVGNAGKTWYKAGANVSSAGSSSEISVVGAAMSNGKAQPAVTADYITMTISGEDLVTALGNGDTIVNNIAIWNSTSSGAQPVNIYIDSIVINLVENEPEVVGKDLLQFNDNDSLAIVENSYVKDGFPAASIITDGDRTVLSGVFTAKSSAGYKGALTIGIGGKYKASEIANVVITFRVPELVGNAGKTWYKAGANVSSAGSSSEISIKSAAMSNGKAQPAVTTDYITMTISGTDLVTALGNGDTIVNNIAIWNSTSSGAQPVNIYIDSIVINLA